MIPTHLGDQSGSIAIVASFTRHTRFRTISSSLSIDPLDQRLSRDERAERRRLGTSTTSNSLARTHTLTRTRPQTNPPYGRIRRPRSVSTSPEAETYRLPTALDFSDDSSLTELSSPTTLSPTPAHTPLHLHTAHTPNPYITISSLIHHHSDSDDDMPDIEPFKGVNPRKENPQAWLRRLEGTKFKHDSDDKSRIYTFSKYLDYGSKADTWFTSELTAADKASWADLVKAFNKKWPPLVKVLPTKSEKQAELLELKLGEDEIGRKIGDDEDDQVWSHVDWAQRVGVLADEIGDSNGLLISIVRNNLPLAIRTLLPNDISTWDKFCQGICNISIDRLSDEVDRDNILKSTGTAIAHLSIASTPTPQRQRTTPYRTPYHRFQPAPEPQTPSPAPRPTAPNTSTPTTPARAAGNTQPFTPSPFASRSSAGNTLVATQVHATPFATGKSGFMALAQQAIDKNKPYPKTDEGFRKYNTALASWRQRYGQDTDANWDTDLLPLYPGTSPLGSSECFRCGVAGHNRAQCEQYGHPEIPTQEGNFRAKISGILRSRRTNDTLPVFIIDTEEVVIDNSVFDTSALEFGESEEQGNESGSRY